MIFNHNTQKMNNGYLLSSNDGNTCKLNSKSRCAKYIICIMTGIIS